MTGYIEREAALKEFEKVCNVCMALVNKPMCGDCSVADTIRKVKSIPAADVRSVVRGKWKLDSDPGEPWRYVCNICGEKTKDTVMGKPRANYCPSCGADMRKGS